MLLLPKITTSFPVKSILYSSNIFITPYGVHDINVSSPMQSFPTLEGVNPSTSFEYVILLKASLISKCLGIGLCNKMPLISLFLFK